MLRNRRFKVLDLTLGAYAVLVLVVVPLLSSGCGQSEPVQDMGDEMEAGEQTAMTARNQSGDVPFAPRFTTGGEMILPEGEIWREWPYVGTPLTPNALNDGEAPFPEFHSVYIDPASWEHWRRTGTFRDGTVLAKELVSVLATDAEPDGSTRQVSGRGYFMEEFIGFEIAYKSAAHFPDEPGNWAYFSFGHHPQPYAASTPKRPVADCNVCHQGSAADDFVFTQFYPVLRASKGPTATIAGSVSRSSGER